MVALGNTGIVGQRPVRVLGISPRRLEVEYLDTWEQGLVDLASFRLEDWVDKTATLGVDQAVERAKAIADGAILSQDSYESLLRQMEEADHYPFAMALLQHGISVRTGVRNEVPLVTEVPDLADGQMPGVKSVSSTPGIPAVAAVNLVDELDHGEADTVLSWDSEYPAGEDLDSPNLTTEHSNPIPRRTEGAVGPVDDEAARVSEAEAAIRDLLKSSFPRASVYNFDDRVGVHLDSEDKNAVIDLLQEHGYPFLPADSVVGESEVWLDFGPRPAPPVNDPNQMSLFGRSRGAHDVSDLSEEQFEDPLQEPAWDANTENTGDLENLDAAGGRVREAYREVTPRLSYTPGDGYPAFVADQKQRLLQRVAHEAGRADRGSRSRIAAPVVAGEGAIDYFVQRLRDVVFPPDLDIDQTMQRITSDFLGVGAADMLTVKTSYSAPLRALYAYALRGYLLEGHVKDVDYLKQHPEGSKVAGCTIPRYLDAEVAPGTTDNLLVAGTLYLQDRENGRAIIAHLDLDPEWGDPGISVTCGMANKQVAERFLRGIATWAYTNNIYRGRKLAYVSTSRGGFVEFHALRPTTWGDVVLPADVVAELRENTVEVLQHMPAHLSSGQGIRRAVLLDGDPGTGKTLSFRAVAHEAPCTTIWITGKSIQYPQDIVGLYAAARQLAPTMLFFEDLDMLGGDRNNGVPYTRDLLAELLAQMDGADDNSLVITCASTNDALRIDAAARRPGRFDRKIAVPLPDAALRRQMLGRFLESTNTGYDADRIGAVLDQLAQATWRFTGAYLMELVRTARSKAIHATGEPFVEPEHFEAAYKVVKANFDLYPNQLGAAKTAGKHGWSEKLTLDVTLEAPEGMGAHAAQEELLQGFPETIGQVAVYDVRLAPGTRMLGPEDQELEASRHAAKTDWPGPINLPSLDSVDHYPGSGETWSLDDYRKVVDLHEQGENLEGMSTALGKPVTESELKDALLMKDRDLLASKKGQGLEYVGDHILRETQAGWTCTVCGLEVTSIESPEKFWNIPGGGGFSGTLPACDPSSFEELTASHQALSLENLADSDRSRDPDENPFKEEHKNLKPMKPLTTIASMADLAQF